MPKAALCSAAASPACAWACAKPARSTPQLLNRDGAHGSDLTEAGNKLLDTYLAIEEKLQKEAEELFEAAFK